MGPPFFSICTPVYNGEPFIAETIESMLTQAFQDWEWILLNDGSTDRGWEIVRQRLGDHPRVRLLENPGNLGQRESLNRLMPEARGEWIGVLPADDGYRAHTLRTVHAYVRDRSDLILWAHSRLAVGQGTPSEVLLIRREVTEWTASDLAEELFLHGNLFGSMANLLFRRSAAIEAGLSFVGDDSRVDTGFWIRLLKSHPGKRAVYHPDVLSYVTGHPNSLSVSCWRSGAAPAAIFGQPLDLVALDWSFRARLLQLARLLKCWPRFGRYLPPGERGLPWRAIRAYLGSLFRGGSGPSRP
jgi:glycosyltransferase involved in cell wall biosynthesis